MESSRESVVAAAENSQDADFKIAVLESEEPSISNAKIPAGEASDDYDNDEKDKDIEDEGYGEHISFREVERVDVSVRNLAITVSPHSALKMPWASKTIEEAEEIRILDDVSADMPAGELTAIIGGSGSGKVCFYYS